MCHKYAVGVPDKRHLVPRGLLAKHLVFEHEDMVEENNKCGELVLYSELDRKPVKFTHQRNDASLLAILVSAPV